MFKTDLITKRNMKQDNSWIVTAPLVWECDKYEITVKPGFDFDFASIPWAMRIILPKNGQKYDRAACLHDALYATHWVPKETADLLLLEPAIADGTNPKVAHSMYLGVKHFGHSAYSDISEEELQRYRKFVIFGVKKK